jgi:hypothetical protein
MSCLAAVLQLLFWQARRADRSDESVASEPDCERGAKPTRGDKIRTNIADRGAADDKLGPVLA